MPVNPHVDRGLELAAGGKIEEAFAAFDLAVQSSPRDFDAWFNLGVAAQMLGRLDEAGRAYRRTIDLLPQAVEPHNNLGFVLFMQGHLTQSAAECDKALALDPNVPLAHWNRGLMLLLRGDFRQGWKEYEWRWKTTELNPKPIQTNKPMWDGSDLGGKTIFLYAEQGYGDTLQFARYIPKVAARNGRISVACQSGLLRLLKSNFSNIQTWISGSNLVPLHDVHCPLMSLPMIFGEIVSNVPYISADAISSPSPCTQGEGRCEGSSCGEMHPHPSPLPEYRERGQMPGRLDWKSRTQEAGERLKVGLAWQGRREHLDDRNRSVPANVLSRIGNIPGVWFTSLQKEPANKPEIAMTDWTNDLVDFAETAALIANLDLVVTVDSAAAHLAGAMGKQVWLLLPVVPDWRWRLARTDSEWYPTMGLFRQTRASDWSDVIERVSDALRGLVETGKGKR